MLPARGYGLPTDLDRPIHTLSELSLTRDLPQTDGRFYCCTGGSLPGRDD